MPLNPDQNWIIHQITRSDVADAFNQYLEAETDTGVRTQKPFAPDDDRLTNNVCRRYALVCETCIDDLLADADHTPWDDGIAAILTSIPMEGSKDES